MQIIFARWKLEILYKLKNYLQLQLIIFLSISNTLIFNTFISNKIWSIRNNNGFPSLTTIFLFSLVSSILSLQKMANIKKIKDIIDIISSIFKIKKKLKINSIHHKISKQWNDNFISTFCFTTFLALKGNKPKSKQIGKALTTSAIGNEDETLGSSKWKGD